MKKTLIMILSGCSLALIAAPALASQCANIPSVMYSALPLMNTEAGGHLTKHIYGMIPPPGSPQQVNNSLFADADAWQEAWNTLVSYSGTIECPKGAPVGTMFGKTLNQQEPVDSVLCSTASPTGRCTAGTPYQGEQVTYVFKVVLQDGRAKWILFTAYPERLPPVTPAQAAPYAPLPARIAP